MNTEIKTIKELCEFIWSLEDKYNLIDLELDGVKVWQYARMKLYYLLAQRIGVLAQPHNRMTMFEKVKVVYKYIINTLLYSPFYAGKVDAIIFPHQRVKEVQGKYIDIYTEYLKEELISEEVSLIEVEYPYEGVHKRQKTKSIYYGDIFVLSRMFSRFFKVRNDKRSMIENVQNEIFSQLNIDINLNRLLTYYVRQYKMEYWMFRKFFKMIRPTTIYLTVSYGKGALIKAAKELNITTVELQHGTFSKFHLGYSFPKRYEPLAYFPDRFFVWEEFWKTLIVLPISDQNVVVNGFAHMQHEKAAYKNMEKNRKQVVVLSQGAIGEKIAKTILKNIQYFSDMNIKYKLHPGEYDRWKTYPSLCELAKYGNIEIIKDCDLYQLFAGSYYQVGVFSTAIYEGLEFGCKTVLLDIEGIEYMEALIKNGVVSIYKDGQALTDV